jgi:DNA-binding transcriptional LysR family regulator
VRLVLDQTEDATLQLMSFGGRADTLTLAVLPTFGSRWLVPRLCGFMSLHPSIQLNVRTYIEPFDFEASDVDLALHFGSDVWPAAVCHRLMGEVAVPVCAPSLIGQRCPLDDPCDVGRHMLLQHATRPSAWLDWFAQLGVTGPHALAGPRFDQFYMVIQAAISGLGMALLPSFLVGDELASGRLVVAARQDLQTSSAYWLVYPQQKAHLPPVTLFRDWLLEAAREEAPDPAAPPASLTA